MTDAELFSEGINLMISGMGFVLTFLIVLIDAISFISKIINKFVPEPLPAPLAKPTPSVAPTDNLDHLRPVIAAAIAHHRRQQGLK